MSSGSSVVESLILTGVPILKLLRFVVMMSHPARMAPVAAGLVSALVIAGSMGGRAQSPPTPVNEGATGTSAAEGVAADEQGNVYGAEVGPRTLKKYVKERP